MMNISMSNTMPVCKRTSNYAASCNISTDLRNLNTCPSSCLSSLESVKQGALEWDESAYIFINNKKKIIRQATYILRQLTQIVRHFKPLA